LPSIGAVEKRNEGLSSTVSLRDIADVLIHEPFTLSRRTGAIEEEAAVQTNDAGDTERFRSGRREKSSVEPISLSDLESPEVLAIVRAWNKWRGFHGLPRRETLQPRDLGRFAANASLVHVVDDGADYEFRIIGDAHLQAYGTNFTGLHMRDVISAAPKFGRLLKASYDLVRSTGRPYAFRGIVGYDAPDARFSWFETCYLPFGSGAAEVDYILNAASYTPRR
jgi:hypothetical protein